MLILFIYITRIASNEKFKLNIKSLIIIPVVSLLTLTFNNQAIETRFIREESTIINSTTLINLSIIKFINYPINVVLIFIIIYLLLTLIATVKISRFKRGPLRQIN
jgi:hypothetical protein